MTRWLPLGAPLAVAALAACGGQPSGAPVPLADGWTVARPVEVGLDPTRLALIDSLEAQGALGVLHSVVVVKDGKLAFERYYPAYRGGPPPIAPTLDGMVPDRPFPPEPSGPLGPANVPPHTIQSASKGITALVVGVAVDRGLVRLDQRIAELLPRYAPLIEADPRKARMTLRHVLTMTTGLDWKEAAIPYQDPKNLARRLNASDDWAAFTLGQPMADEPGTRFEYCSGCTLLLSAILQRATGQHVDQFAEETIFRPLGIEDAIWIRHARSTDSLSHTGGGLWLRPRDFAKLGWLVVDDGQWRGRRIISSEWIRAIGSPHVDRGIAGYSYQWLIRAVPGLPSSGPEDLVYAWGAAGQFVFAVKPLRMVVVVNGSNWGDDIANSAFGLKILETAVSAATR